MGTPPPQTTPREWPLLRLNSPVRTCTQPTRVGGKMEDQYKYIPCIHPCPCTALNRMLSRHLLTKFWLIFCSKRLGADFLELSYTLLRGRCYLGRSMAASQILSSSCLVGGENKGCLHKGRLFFFSFRVSGMEEGVSNLWRKKRRRRRRDFLKANSTGCPKTTQVSQLCLLNIML